MIDKPMMLTALAATLLASSGSPAIAQSQIQASPPGPSAQAGAPVVCPMGMPGMGPGRMQGGAGAPMQNMADWQQMHQTMQQMRAEMQAMRSEMAQLRQEMQRRR